MERARIFETVLTDSWDSWGRTFVNSDQVQVRGGHVALQVTSNLFFGISGTSAGRTFTNATNINAKDAGQWYNPIDSHSSMHSNIAIWKKYIAPKFQK